MSARQHKVSLPRPEALLWDAHRRSWIMIVPTRSFLRTAPKREDRRRRTVITGTPSVLPVGPGVSWIVVAVLTVLLAIVCGLVALLLGT
jgi:hypothetical protein